MITLGIDIGSSSIKAALFDAEKGKSIIKVSYPPSEMEIISQHEDWAEQDANVWMENITKAIGIIKEKHPKELKNAGAIGITYQMHGLVAVDKNGNPLRNAIIWCDSRAVDIGNKAFEEMGSEFCLGHLLNSPGNFTASKLKWIKEQEADKYKQIHKIMLPGDYIAYRLTNEIRTSSSGLSEGIFWDYHKNGISEELISYYGFDRSFLPEFDQSFSEQGYLTKQMAETLGMKAGIPVSYRAGDQPNNAFSLKVLHPGEVAATAGTSGVFYGVTDKKEFDPLSRVNTFLHVNNTPENSRLGILLCLNSVGILNSWTHYQFLGEQYPYKKMNEIAARAPEGSAGLIILPFGNGAERVLENKNIGASFNGLHFNIHKRPHVLRAMQEGIAFAFQYGIEIMEKLGLNLRVIRAGKANMFLSNLFAQSLANISRARIELYNTDGAEGAARGAAVGIAYFKTADEAFNGLEHLETIEPDNNSHINEYYNNWKEYLKNRLESDI